MISYEKFNEYMTAIKRTYDFQIELINLTGKYSCDAGICEYPTCSCELVSLLATIMNDEYDWIDYFCWELNFGKDYHDGTITDSNGKTALGIFTGAVKSIGTYYIIENIYIILIFGY